MALTKTLLKLLQQALRNRWMITFSYFDKNKKRKRQRVQAISIDNKYLFGYDYDDKRYERYFIDKMQEIKIIKKKLQPVHAGKLYYPTINGKRVTYK